MVKGCSCPSLSLSLFIASPLKLARPKVKSEAFSMSATPSAKKTSLPISINSCFVALSGTSKVRLPPPLAYRTETNLFLLLLNSISPNAILLVLGAFVVELVSSDELALGLVLRGVDFLFCLSCFPLSFLQPICAFCFLSLNCPGPCFLRTQGFQSIYVPLS